MHQTNSIQHYMIGVEYNSASGINRRVEVIYHAEGRFFNTNTGTTTDVSLRVHHKRSSWKC
ncbi:MAG: hypothetical protein IPL23_12865 [Saprospiraceae bacterium]|nr:hypothetical protein [Saprospiraceae bacterium]